MKKIVICFFICLFGINIRAYAADYDIILGRCIRDIGVFQSGEGIVYADVALFEGRELLAVVYLKNNAINCDLYSADDGAEKVDSISFTYGGNNQYIFSLGSVSGGDGCIILDTNEKREVFILQKDTLRRIYDAAVYDEERIVSCNSNSIVCEINPAKVYDFLNREKEKKISKSAFTDCKNEIGTQKLNKMYDVLNCVGDVIEFDSKNVDLIRLLKNVLYTSHKYENIVGLKRDYKKNSQEAGLEEIQSVNGEYIDYILIRIFGVEPEHLSVNNLIENDVCYTNGRYFFRGGYTDEFNTEIERIDSVYDLGGGRYYLIFFDEYTQNEYALQEYGYAVLDENDDKYTLVKLSVGGDLLDDARIKEYSFRAKEEGLFFKDGDDFLFAEKRRYAIKILIGIAIVSFCVACAVMVFYFVGRRNK